MFKKKVISVVLLLAFVCNIVYATEIHRKGEVVVFKQDMQCFSMTEAKKILLDLKNIEVDKQKIVVMQKLIDSYERQIEVLKSSIVSYENATKAYKEAMQALKDGVQEYKNATSIYKDIVTVQTESLKIQMNQANYNRKTRKWERNLSFLLGFACPVLGAWSLGKVGFAIK